MNKEIKIVVGVGLAAGTVAGAYAISKRPIKANERSKESMFDLKKDLVELGEDVREDGKVVETINFVSSNPPSLAPIEKEKIRNMVSGMNEAEMRVALNSIPMTLIFDHITGVLEKNRAFAQSVQDAMNRLQE